MPNRRLVALIAAPAAVIAAGLIAFVATLQVTRIGTGSLASFTPPAAAAPTPTPVPLTDLARADLSRVVTIEAERSSDEELGTGWLFDARGDFVTNAHVISGQLTVRIRDRLDHSHVGRVIGVDPVNDIAVIRSTDGFGGPALSVDHAQLPRVPFPVIAVASGRATGRADMTVETLTQLGQDVPVDSTDVQPGAGGPTTYHDMLELDGARIFQGNSGGPVLDGAGDVIGIVTLASKATSEAFAIPLSRVYAELSTFSAR